jgi:MFS family permease
VLDKRQHGLTRYLVGATTARLGDEMTGPAVLLLALTVSSTANTGPALVAALTAASAIGGPLLGALLDRSPRPGRLMGGALIGTAVGIATVGLLLGRVPLTMVLAVGLLAGLLRPAVSGGWSSRLTFVVDDRRLPRATSWDGATFDLAAFLGPVLVGVLVLVLDPAFAMAAAALLITAAVPSAWMLNGASAGGPRRTPLVADLRAAARAIMQIAPLRRATSVSVISYVGFGILGTSLPLLSLDVLGSADYAPLLAAGLAAGGLLANLVISFRRTVLPADRLLLITVCLLCCSMALGAIAVVGEGGSATLLLITAVLITGAADGPQLVAVLRIRHREAPVALRGQIFTTAASLKITGYACGAAVSGPLAGWSLPAALLVASGCQLVAVGCYLAQRATR